MSRLVKTLTAHLTSAQVQTLTAHLTSEQVKTLADLGVYGRLWVRSSQVNEDLQQYQYSRTRLQQLVDHGLAEWANIMVPGNGGTIASIVLADDGWSAVASSRTGGYTERREQHRRTNGIDPNGDPFVWGRVQTIHMVGDYAIVEADHFHPYIWQPSRCVWACINRSWTSLDSALIGTIIYRREWLQENKDIAANSRLADYVMRLLPVPEGKEL